MPSQLRHFIGGELVEGSSARTGEVFDPAAGSVTALVPFASREEVDRAVVAARAAFESWREVPAIRRARVMFKFLRVLDATFEK